MEMLPLSEVRAGLSELVTQVEKQHDQITVTRNGRAAAVVVSIDEWESIRETIEILSDSDTVAAIAEARADIERGDVYTTEQLEEFLEHARRMRH